VRDRSRIPSLIALLVASVNGCGGGGGAASQASDSGRHTASGGPPRQVAPRNTGVLAPSPPREAAVRACSAAKLHVAIATDRRSYRQAQAVMFTVNARNDAGSSCSVPTGPCLPQILVTASNRVVVWNRAELQVVCAYRAWRRLGPGGSTRQVVTWNGKRCAGNTPTSCPGAPVGPGSYRALASWDSLKGASILFVIRR
jgi:hypothetical protein